MVEYCARHVTTGGIARIQVKAISVNAEHPRGTVKVPPHTFRPTPNTWFTVFAERRDYESLHPSCLLIPSMDVGDLLIDHAGERSFTWTQTARDVTHPLPPTASPRPASPRVSPHCSSKPGGAHRQAPLITLRRSMPRPPA